MGIAFYGCDWEVLVAKSVLHQKKKCLNYCNNYSHAKKTKEAERKATRGSS